MRDNDSQGQIMIEKQLAEIAEADLLALISNGVAEGRTIDYKRDMPGNSDGDKKEFLADVSSFANSGGGDLVFGMEEAAGLPTRLVGLASGDLDFEIRRIDSILAAGLSPRIRYGTRPITPATGNKSLVLRVESTFQMRVHEEQSVDQVFDECVALLSPIEN